MKTCTSKQLLAAILLILFALFSVLVITKVAVSPQFHEATIAALDEKQSTVLELTATSTAASAAITLLPGDAATPIAEKLADLSSGFLVVLCAIYLEKYLLTITGYAAFTFLIPAACILYTVRLFVKWDSLAAMARKLLLFGIAIVLIIPVSVKASGLIEDTYRASISSTLETAKETTAEVESSAEENSAGEDEGFLAGLIGKITDGISSAASGVSDKVGDMVNNFLEALAVMLVTSCVIPILVLLLFVWLVKITFSVDLPHIPSGISRKRTSHASGDESDVR